jgi:hypothetical protein
MVKYIAAAPRVNSERDLEKGINAMLGVGGAAFPASGLALAGRLNYAPRGYFGSPSTREASTPWG